MVMHCLCHLGLQLSRCGSGHNPTASWEGKIIPRALSTFNTIRAVFGVSNAVYLESMQWPLQMMLSNSRSGSFFYFTEDSRFMVKSISQTEVAVLRDILDRYLDWVTQQRSTLLPRFFGCHAIRYGSGGELVHFVVMANVNQSMSEIQNEMYTARTYDIKGSRVNRSTDGTGTLKDNDLTSPFVVSAQSHQQLIQQLRRDTQWLCSRNIMDYSLLLTAVGCSHNEPEEVTRIAHPCCQSRDELTAPFACVGLIDVLQEFDCNKRLEYCAKSICHGTTSGLSCLPSQPYQHRFMLHVSEEVFAKKGVE